MEIQIHDRSHQEHHDAQEEIAEEEASRRAIRDEWLHVVMEEYRTLRREIIASLAMQQSALTLGTLAVGGLTLAGLHEWSDPESKLPFIVFLVVLPLVSYVTVFIWLAEYARAMRAGRFIVGIERKVNAVLGREALGWEIALRSPDGPKAPQFTWNVWAIFSFFLVVVPITSVVIGNTSARGLGFEPNERLLFDLLELGVFLVPAFFLYRAFSHARADGCILEPEERSPSPPVPEAPERGARARGRLDSADEPVEHERSRA